MGVGLSGGGLGLWGQALGSHYRRSRSFIGLGQRRWKHRDCNAPQLRNIPYLIIGTPYDLSYIPEVPVRV